MLNLLRSCLSKSQNMRELALSMDFDMSKYQQNINESAFMDSNNCEKSSKSFSQNEKCDSIIQNIETLIHKDESGK